jgi:mycofactocin precursor
MKDRELNPEERSTISMLTVIEKPASTYPADPAVTKAEPSTPTEPPKTMGLKENKLDVEKPRILDEVVIEEVSIDGMCGVY